MTSHREHQGSNSSSVPPLLCPRLPPDRPYSSSRVFENYVRVYATRALLALFSTGNRTRTNIYYTRQNELFTVADTVISADMT